MAEPTPLHRRSSFIDDGDTHVKGIIVCLLCVWLLTGCVDVRPRYPCVKKELDDGRHYWKCKAYIGVIVRTH